MKKTSKLIVCILFVIITMGLSVNAISVQNNTEVQQLPVSGGLANDFYEGLAVCPTYTDNKCMYGYVDTSGNLALDYKWEFASVFSEGVAWVKDVNGKWGVIDKTGNYVIEPTYEWYDSYVGYSYKFGLCTITDKNGNIGLIDRSCNFIIQPQDSQYYNINILTPDLFCVQNNNNKWAVFNSKGEELLPFEYDGGFNVEMLNGVCLISIYKNGMAGYLDAKGNVIIPPQYTNYSVSNYLDNKQNRHIILDFEKEGKKGLYFLDSKVFVEPIYDSLEFHDDVFYFQDDGKWGIMGLDNHMIIEPIYDEISLLGNDCYHVSISNKIGILSSDGTKILDPVYDRIGYEKDSGYYRIELNGKSGIANKDGKIILDANYQIITCFSSGQIRAYNETKHSYDIFNENGENLTSAYDRADYNGGDLISVCKDNKWGYIDKNKNVVIPLQYCLASVFTDGVAAVKISKYSDCISFIDQKGQVVKTVPNTGSYYFDKILNAEKGIFSLQNSADKYEIMNFNGDLISSFQWDDVQKANYGNGLIEVYVNGKRGIITEDGKIIVGTDIGYLSTSYGDMNTEGNIRFKLGDGSYLFIYPNGDTILSMSDVSEPRIDSKNQIIYTNDAYYTISGQRLTEAGAQIDRMYFNEYGILITQKDGIYSVVNNAGVMSSGWNYMNYYSNGLFGIRKTIGGVDYWGAMDIKGKIIVQPLYKGISIYNGLIEITDFNDKMGIFDRNLNVVLPIEYDRILSFNNAPNKLAAIKDNKYYFITLNLEDGNYGSYINKADVFLKGINIYIKDQETVENAMVCISFYDGNRLLKLSIKPKQTLKQGDNYIDLSGDSLFINYFENDIKVKGLVWSEDMDPITSVIK